MSDVTVAEALQLLADGALLIDVREQDEWDAGHAPQARHLPLSALNQRAGELPRDRQLVCVCHIGGRSAMVTRALNQAGWQVANLEGGMQAWQLSGQPVVDADGNPGEAR
ncbi:MAG TPA: rhodanese-like domain-containing protein [Jatrophihabitans sp.]|nr:rhodanese-like domain-containing protein [Jatrophihabitans sp.]